MTLADLLAREDVLVDLRSPDKTRLLAELSGHAARRLDLARDRVLDALLRREELGSTGMGDGIALPHARLPEARLPFGVLARLRAPVPFDAVDGLPVDLVFLLLLPETGSGRQLNALACVARTMRDPATAAALRSARDVPAAREVLVRSGSGL